MINEKIAKFVPRDKGSTIRMVYLDLTQGYGPNHAINFLESKKDLSGDEKAALSVARSWEGNGPIDVLESRTMFIFLQFYFWKNKIAREILTRGTLTQRIKEMEATEKVATWPLAKLLTLEGGTSQFASAAILLGNEEILPENPFYLQKTYNVRSYWLEQKQLGHFWIPQPDPTITVQIQEYINFLKTGKINIIPDRLGDCDLYCFLHSFGKITTEEGKKIWPQLCKHESNRFCEMELRREECLFGRIIHTRDHRVVSAYALLMQSMNLNLSVDAIRVSFIEPDCVNKAWPQFWNFVKETPSILNEI